MIIFDVDMRDTACRLPELSFGADSLATAVQLIRAYVAELEKQVDFGEGGYPFREDIDNWCNSLFATHKAGEDYSEYNSILCALEFTICSYQLTVAEDDIPAVIKEAINDGNV